MSTNDFDGSKRPTHHYPPRRKSRRAEGEFDAPSKSPRGRLRETGELPAIKPNEAPFYPVSDARQRPTGDDMRVAQPAREIKNGTEDAVERFASNMGIYDGGAGQALPSEGVPQGAFQGGQQGAPQGEPQGTPQPSGPSSPRRPASPVTKQKPPAKASTSQKKAKAKAGTIDSSVDLFNGGKPQEKMVTAKAVEARRRRKRNKRLKTTGILLAVIVLVVGVSVSAISFLGGMSLFTGAQDYPGPGTGKVVVTIPPGATGTKIAEILKKKDVVASEKAFIEAFKNNSLSEGIQAGSYNLKHKMKASGALAALLDPASKAEVKVTVVPGTTVEQIKEKVIAVRGFNQSDVDKALKDTDALGLPKEAKGNLEGWLAPETYTIEPDMTPKDLFKMMVDHTVKELDDLNIPANEREEFLTKASIVEKEGDSPEYYGKMARVIDNRITHTDGETRGLLQMDCTVAYGVGKAGTGRLVTPEDIKKDTPYNTYIHKGLPPAPISNASLAVFKAVANPPKGDWLYYVTVDLNTGETKFATTYDEQKKNIEKFKEFCKKNPDICKG